MFRVVCILGLIAAGWAAVAAAGPYRAPRTTFGQPDLQGVWGSDSATPLERPDEFKSVEVSDAAAAAYERHLNDFDAQVAEYKKANPRAPNVGFTSEWPELQPPLRLARIGGVARSSILIDPPDGKLPRTPKARERRAARRMLEQRNFDGPETRTLAERCIYIRKPPMVSGDPIRIVQTPDQIVLQSELGSGVRIVNLRDRTHQPEQILTWTGDSVGWWEGDTLAVETTRFNPGIALFGSGTPLSPSAKVVERFTRVSAREIIYRFTVEDPETYTRPWSGVLPLTIGDRMFTYECHEGNYGLVGILAGARRVERDGGVPEALDGGDPPPAAKTASSAPAPAGPPRPANPPAP